MCLLLWQKINFPFTLLRFHILESDLFFFSLLTRSLTRVSGHKGTWTVFVPVKHICCLSFWKMNNMFVADCSSSVMCKI